ncbi:Uncharacterised protein [Mycobacteroides abscessus subsp. abscessus]|nr:Uncharacterised protein [Mycobacteroides abscessus subsp. abscessus]
MRELFEESRDRIRTGEFSRCRARPAVDHHRNAGVLDEAPHRGQQRIGRGEGTDLNVDLEYPHSRIDRLTYVVCGAGFGKERGGVNAVRGLCRELGRPLV